MIISHKYKFIFVKTRKVGGTSIEFALAELVGPKDVVTPFWQPDEIKRKELGLAGGPQNYLRALNSVPALHTFVQSVKGAISTNDFARISWERLTQKYWEHILACDIRRKVGERIWQDYTSFTIERNSWDKVVSGYYFLYRNQRLEGSDSLSAERERFYDFIRSGEAVKRVSDLHAYQVNGRTIVDRVLQYDRLQDELASLADELGMPKAPNLSRSRVNAKGSYRSQEGRQLYTDETRRAVAEAFAREIEMYGYEFPF